MPGRALPRTGPSSLTQLSCVACGLGPLDHILDRMPIVEPRIADGYEADGRSADARRRAMKLGVYPHLRYLSCDMCVAYSSSLIALPGVP